MKFLPYRLFLLGIAIASHCAVAAKSDVDEKTWRALDPNNVLIMEMESGEVIIELAPQFAPKHVANIKQLVAQKFFDNSAVIRSHDNYVAQWGDPNFDNDQRRSLGDAKSTLVPEFYRTINEVNYTPIESRDAYADEVGFVDGFAVASDKKRAWMAHCYGAVGVGRDNAPNSGNGSSLYAVTGHSPRHLDLNVTLVGRVIQGIEHLSSLPRGTEALGFYASEEEHAPIKTIRLASELLNIEIMNTSSDAFAERVAARTTRSHEWFMSSTGKIELCNVGVPSRSTDE